MNLRSALFPSFGSFFVRFLFIGATGVLLAACDDPAKRPDVGDLPATEPSSSDKEPAPTEPAVSSQPQASAPPTTVEEAAPEKPSEPLTPLLDVRENEQEKTVVLSGHISSKYQAQDIIDGIGANFPGIKVINELKIDPKIPQVTWGNRVTDLLLPAIQKVEDMHFNYHEGVTLMEGNVKSPGEIGQIGNLIVGVMEAPDSRGVTNNLKATGKGNEKGKGKGGSKGEP